MNVHRNACNSVTIIGEVNLDVSFTIDAPFTAINANRQFYVDVHHAAGGTGGNFALAAAPHFATVRLLTRLGNDTVGQTVYSMLRAAGIECRNIPDCDHPTRTVVSARSISAESRAGVRLMIADPDSPAYWLEPRHVDIVRPWLETSDLLFIDAYSMLSEVAEESATHAMKLARDGGSAVAVDIVPHNIFEFKSLGEIQEFTKNASIIICELHTLQRLLGIVATPRTLHLEDACFTIPRAREAFAGAKLLLRFGAGNVDDSIIDLGSDVAYTTNTGYISAKDKRAFGDHLAARELCMIVQNRSPEVYGYSRVRLAQQGTS